MRAGRRTVVLFVVLTARAAGWSATPASLQRTAHPVAARAALQLGGNDYKTGAARWRTSAVGDGWVTDGRRNGTSDPAAGGPTIFTLARRADALYSSWADESDADALAAAPFESSFRLGDGSRGWASWLVHRKLIVGMYPHAQPVVPGPSADDADAHLRALISAGVTSFACVQSEVPPQADASAWQRGEAFLEEPARTDAPAPFVRYADGADAIAPAAPPLAYLHCPIADGATPRDGLGQNTTLLRLLDEVLAHYEEGGGAVYVHSWLGRGRANLAGACLLSLLRQDLDAPALLAQVDGAFGLRAGADAMPVPTARRHDGSLVYKAPAAPRAAGQPMPMSQQRFLASFVSSVRAAKRLQNDMDMVMGGLPRSFL